MLRRDSGQRFKRSKSSRDASGAGAARGRRSAPVDPFVLYVEGARDREILTHWARRVDGDLTRCIERHAVIMGGRQPARAVTDFRKRGGAGAGFKGLVVLDRDHHEDEAGEGELEENGLEIFVWSLRHIESYLLVPETLRRLLRLDADDRRVERFVEDEGAESLHAKRILGSGGSLSLALGAELRAGEIARAMRHEELHPDIFTLFDRIGDAAGLSRARPEVVVRSRQDPTP